MVWLLRISWEFFLHFKCYMLDHKNSTYCSLIIQRNRDMTPLSWKNREHLSPIMASFSIWFRKFMNFWKRMFASQISVYGLGIPFYFTNFDRIKIEELVEWNGISCGIHSITIWGVNYLRFELTVKLIIFWTHEFSAIIYSCVVTWLTFNEFNSY